MIAMWSREFSISEGSLFFLYFSTDSTMNLLFSGQDAYIASHSM